MTIITTSEYILDKVNALDDMFDLIPIKDKGGAFIEDLEKRTDALRLLHKKLVGFTAEEQYIKSGIKHLLNN